MHQEIDKSRHQKGLCMRISAIKSTVRLQNQFSLMNQNLGALL